MSKPVELWPSLKRWKHLIVQNVLKFELLALNSVFYSNLGWMHTWKEYLYAKGAKIAKDTAKTSFFEQ